MGWRISRAGFYLHFNKRNVGNGKFGAYIELYGYAPQNSSADHRCSAGVSYLLKPNVMFDLSGGYAFSEKAPDYYMGVGFSFRLKD
ncbi:MAG: transporter [Bacteroidetes bacterium]|nr:transporter [Bacteroidota bacterium]